MRGEINDLQDHDGEGDALERARARLSNAFALLGIANVASYTGKHSAEVAARAAGRDPLEVNETQVDSLIAARADARAAKDFAEADRIRDELDAMGVALMDGPDGTTWELKR